VQLVSSCSTHVEQAAVIDVSCGMSSATHSVVAPGVMQLQNVCAIVFASSMVESVHPQHSAANASTHLMREIVRRALGTAQIIA
jgi:hypothetical protein